MNLHRDLILAWGLSRESFGLVALGLWWVRTSWREHLLCKLAYLLGNPKQAGGTKNRPKCKAFTCSEYPTCSYGPTWYTLALKGLWFSPSTTLDGHPAHLWITSERNILLRGNIHNILVPSARPDLLKLRALPNSIRLCEEVFIPQVFGETHPTTSASNHKATFNWLRK